jgi:hypothetical protein
MPLPHLCAFVAGNMVKFTFTFYMLILIAWKFRTAVSELRSEDHLELISSNIRTTTRMCVCVFSFFYFLQTRTFRVNGIWIS